MTERTRQRCTYNLGTVVHRLLKCGHLKNLEDSIFLETLRKQTYFILSFIKWKPTWMLQFSLRKTTETWKYQVPALLNLLD